MKRQADSGNHQNYFGVLLNFKVIHFQKLKMLGGKRNKLTTRNANAFAGTFAIRMSNRTNQKLQKSPQANAQ